MYYVFTCVGRKKKISENLAFFFLFGPAHEAPGC